MADNAAAIQVSSGRDILVAPGANLTTVTSGALSLMAARDINLKVSDGGTSVNTTHTAAGDLVLNATGAVTRTDPDALNLAGKRIGVTAASFTPGAGGGMTANAGDIQVSTSGAINTVSYSVTAAQTPVSYTHLDVYKRQDTVSFTQK